MKEQLAKLRVNDYIRAEGVDTRGHTVVRTGHLLAQPKEVMAQRSGTRMKGWRLFVGVAGTSIDQRSTWVTLFPGAGSVEHARQPEVGEWQQTPFGKIPGVRTSPDVNVRVLFGGKGGKRSKEPTQRTLARLVHSPDKHRYEVRDAETGETLLCPSWQTAIWWAVAPAEEEHGDQDQAVEPALADEPVAGKWRNTKLRQLPGIKANSRQPFYFGGRGGKNNTEPAEPVVLAEVAYTQSGRYEIRDKDAGDVLMTCALQSQIWWAPAPCSLDDTRRDEDGDPKESMQLTLSVVPDTLPDEEDDLGQPVHHVVTGDMVGYLSSDKFIPIGQVEKR
ncbi:hypothetical protein ABT274_12335 [Streptomyces sp. NPDC001127]|uniref:hypothetical protein n=1 Tax=Streptomyces sp. NPDC001127 TaxID=3154377 RepID=UPI00331D33CC